MLLNELDLSPQNWYGYFNSDILMVDVLRLKVWANGEREKWAGDKVFSSLAA